MSRVSSNPDLTWWDWLLLADHEDRSVLLLVELLTATGRAKEGMAYTPARAVLEFPSWSGAIALSYEGYRAWLST
jgi:hypothetical protein